MKLREQLSREQLISCNREAREREKQVCMFKYLVLRASCDKACISFISHQMSWPYFVRGTVVHGFGRGSRELGCPTANLDNESVSKVNIPTGVYWGLAQVENAKSSADCSVDDEIRPMICSMGYNPYYNNETKSLEVHIMHEYKNDFYDTPIKVAICGRIRDETSFPSLQALIDAIESDKRFAREALKSVDTNEIKQLLSREETFTNEKSS